MGLDIRAMRLEVPPPPPPSPPILPVSISSVGSIHAGINTVHGTASIAYDDIQSFSLIQGFVGFNGHSDVRPGVSKHLSDLYSSVM